MGSKSIFVVGALASGAFLYYSIYKSDMPSTINKSNIEQSQISKAKIEPELKVVEKETKVVKIEPEIAKKEELISKEVIEEVVEEEVIGRISIPAFGFMSSKNKNQIVALMSDNEKDGELAKYIKWLCAKKECAKDIRFENNIMDSSWQKGAVKIIELFEDDRISGGSLFIESNTLKIEGRVNSQEAKNRLDAILKSLKSANLKIQSYTKLADFKKEQIKSEKVEPKKEPKVEASKAPKVIPEIEAPKVAKITPVEKPIVKEVVKPVVKSTPKPEVVPEPFMETTLDVAVQKSVASEYSIEDAQMQLESILKAEAITFDGKGNLISENSKKTLQEIIKLINTLNNQKIKVSGFTDFSSDKVYNKVLSQKKADTVTRYLKNSGLKSKHVKSIGYGDAKPSHLDGVAIEIDILGETK